MPHIRTLPAAWTTRTYPTDTTYVITHATFGHNQEILIETSALQAEYHDIRHNPHHPHNRRPGNPFPRLGDFTITAGTTWADALSQMTAAVPAPYRDLLTITTLIGPTGERRYTLGT